MPLFSDLTEGEMLDVLRFAKVVRFKGGEYLCRTGEPGKSMYVIDSGRASVQVPRTDRASIEVKMLGPGQVIGEMALVDSRPRSADVMAVDDVQAYELDRVEFDKLRKQLNPAAFKMLRHIALTVSARLRELNNFAAGGMEASPPVAAPAEQSAGAFQGWKSRLSNLLKGGS